MSKMDSTGGAAHLVTLTCSPSTGTAVTSLASRAVLAPALLLQAPLARLETRPRTCFEYLQLPQKPAVLQDLELGQSHAGLRTRGGSSPSMLLLPHLPVPGTAAWAETALVFPCKQHTGQKRVTIRAGNRGGEHLSHVSA